MDVKFKIITEIMAFKYALELINKDKKKIIETVSEKEDTNEIKKIEEKQKNNTNDNTNDNTNIDNKTIEYYNGLDIDSLNCEVSNFMTNNGVNKSPVNKVIVDNKFGASNILKLVRKWKVIPVKNGYILGCK